MEIELLYVPDCPNRTLARDHLESALEQVNATGAVVRQREAQTSEEAAQSGMRGSPTILIDGQDPFAEEDRPLSLSCRLYPGEGGMTGAPSIDDLVAVLTRVSRPESGSTQENRDAGPR